MKDYHVLPVLQGTASITKGSRDLALAEQVWLAHVKMKRAEGAQLLYEPFVKQYNFFRECLALVWYYYKGWLC